jgi:hypothetical protein
VRGGATTSQGIALVNQAGIRTFFRGLLRNAVCRQFIALCRQLNLFTQTLVAIDGSKFKAVNNRDRNLTPAKMGPRSPSDRQCPPTLRDDSVGRHRSHR